MTWRCLWFGCRFTTPLEGRRRCVRCDSPDWEEIAEVIFQDWCFRREAPS